MSEDPHQLDDIATLLMWIIVVPFLICVSILLIGLLINC